jgi:hypothetical protein
MELTHYAVPIAQHGSAIRSQRLLTIVRCVCDQYFELAPSSD